MIERPAGFTNNDAWRLQGEMPKVMVRSVLHHIDEDGGIVLRVPGKMQVDLRIDVAGHGALLGTKGRKRRVLKRARPVVGEGVAISAREPVLKGLANEPAIGGKAP